ncbi:MAG: respiratory chain complex I subunit 1 family protein [bacterium]
MNIFTTLIMILVMPFLFAGIINRVKSLWAGRKGPSVFQPMLDCIKLFKKREMISETVSFMFSVGPVFYVSSVLTAVLFVPYGFNKSILSFEGDFLFFAYIMTIGNFFMLLSALDTGSSFEGMGASREASFALFIEPSLFIILSSFIYLSGNTSISKMISTLNFTNSYTIVASLLSIAAFFVMILSEGKRVPVDDPNTHLELTMIHEVMVLDHSGPSLALINYATYLKMTIFTALISSVIFMESGVLFALGGFIAVSIVSAIIVGTIESIMARLKMIYVSQFLLLVFGIALFIIASVLMGRGGGV